MGGLSTERQLVGNTRPFCEWPVASIRVMVALADGKPRSSDEIIERVRARGMAISYQSARNGCVDLWRRGLADREAWSENGAAEQLNAEGQRLAQRLLKLLPAKLEPVDVEPPAPPDPITPLWSVLLEDGGWAVVCAANRRRALELMGDDAVRAIAFDTSAERVIVRTSDGQVRAAMEPVA